MWPCNNQQSLPRFVGADTQKEAGLLDSEHREASHLGKLGEEVGGHALVRSAPVECAVFFGGCDCVHFQGNIYLES